MFLRKINQKHTGRVYLSIVESYRDKTTKKTKSRTIESLGYLDELEKKFKDPIAYYEKIICEMNQKKAFENSDILVKYKSNDKLEVGTNNRKNFGYAAFSAIYHTLEIDKFLINRQRSTKIEASTNNIMKLLVFSRLLNPGSKKKAYDQRNDFFENAHYSLDDVYRALSFFNEKGNELQLWMNEKVKENYGRDTSLVYYDVTNYYFESDCEDAFRCKGVSKEHRPNPIVQMGLFMDTNGIPITYDLYSGNTNDCLTYRPTFSRMKKEFDLGKVIVVADKGMSTGDNIQYTLSANDGFVFSYSARGANKALKDYILDEEGYVFKGDDYKWKERIYPTEIWVTMTSGKKQKKTIDAKQVVFYSEKYAKKARMERAKAIEKAKKLIKTPSNYNRSTSYGAAGYVKNLSFVKDTGEIADITALSLDEEKIKAQEALDGYYVLITSEYKKSASEVIEIYRGLWKIEESFKVTKSDLETRPVYVSTQDHIKAHFLTCFIALVLARILEFKMDGKHTITRIIDSLSKCTCTNVDQNYYLFDYYDEVLKDIGDVTNVDFSTKIRTLQQIKKNISETKTR
ncbi:IS1634 family transposase [Fusibacter sp. 3D3]|uniref:IS1634 family transposase n=2 Tax=Fusibacter sp. 3D3 TaxID=1048380 RepID=UPI000853C6B1|nr:IS1634 family transposase [Fusibacter sp. 3D3]GAU75962.1 mobile element protein [Fusibacter sp. 3D3]GAU76322.1 mobile element protein [Fusibacter sp. 3D3]GAU77281.1 mobile element protein [Fusibacter sp. 3D3]GAU79168.1 mobile element protein [Fusibacter sp. 3D3]